MIHAHTELVSSHHPAASGEAISSVRTENAMNVSSSFQHPFHTFLSSEPWRRKWQPTPVLLPGKSHGQRSLVGYSPWGRKESDTTE